LELVLTQEQELLQSTIRDFSRDAISSLAPKIDQESRVPEELLQKLPEIGLYGITIPSEFGGAGADYLSFLLAVEELSKVSAALGARVSFHGIICDSLAACKNGSLRATLLPKLAGGNISALSVDPKSSIYCKRTDRGEFVLEGTSEYVINADQAGIFLVLARSKSGGAILVCFQKEETDEHLKIGEPKRMMGMRGSGTCSISLHGLKLTDSSLVCDPEVTLSAINRLMIAARFAIASLALGIGQASLDEEVRYANERVQFNTKIGQFYAVQDFIGSDEISIDTARSVTYSAASRPLTDELASRKSCIAKIAASNAAVQSARHSIRVHGGYGFVRDYPVERYLRDARATQIFLEPNEVLKGKIAEDLLR
jgi:acyl-CoA dehydrogenase